MALWLLAGCAALFGDGAGEDAATFVAPSGEVCGNGLDDDGDFLADCADPACSAVCNEVCGDGFDNDGDGEADCNDPSCDGQCPEDCFDGRDNDGDGAVDCLDGSCDGSCEETCGDGRDNDGDDLVDCDDPSCDGACPENDAEACSDGRDNDADSQVDCDDDQCGPICDVDDDGFADQDFGGDDCEDDDPFINPAAPELCNGVDDDCDAAIDDADPSLDPSSATDWYADGDGDGWGGALIDRGCTPPPGLVTSTPGDCADASAVVHPDATEICDGYDDDCDLLSDDADPNVDLTTGLDWYEDADGDGFGLAYIARACAGPPGTVPAGNDCDDDNDAIHPDAVEVCNDAVDDDCDELADDVDPSRDLATTVGWYTDNDLDGWGAAFALLACQGPPGTSDQAGDCNDSLVGVHPGAIEICNADIDDDCDTLADDADPGLDPASRLDWFVDADADGFGGPLVAGLSCVAPDGSAPDDDDCDDGDDAVHPAAVEVCNEGTDDDCDTLVDDGDPSLDPDTWLVWAVDADEDGFGDPTKTVLACEGPAGSVANVDDCDDADEGVGAQVEWVQDLDSDGFGAGVIVAACTKPGGPYVRASLGNDCDDADDAIAPDAPEICGDGIDQDCDGVDDVCPIALPPSLAADISFDEYNNNHPVGLAWDGTWLWSVTQTGADPNHMAVYEPDGTFLLTVIDPTNYRGIAAFTDGTDPLLLRVASDADLLEKEAGDVGSVPGVTLVGGSLDIDANVVWDDIQGEYLALDDDGVVDRWDAGGNWVGGITLAGFGTLFGESAYPQDRRLAVVQGTLLTYSEGTLSAWNRSGTRADTTTLLAAGESAASYWSFSFAAGRAWVIDAADGSWRGYPLGL